MGGGRGIGGEKGRLRESVNHEEERLISCYKCSISHTIPSIKRLIELHAVICPPTGSNSDQTLGAIPMYDDSY